jgi:hypothetical protein
MSMDDCHGSMCCYSTVPGSYVVTCHDPTGCSPFGGMGVDGVTTRLCASDTECWQPAGPPTFVDKSLVCCLGPLWFDDEVRMLRHCAASRTDASPPYTLLCP